MINASDAQNGSAGQDEYMTTTELARLCGVSRFTVINWVENGYLKSIKTQGGHRRISRAVATLFLRTAGIYREKRGAPPELLFHCWDFAPKTNCDKKCGNCIVYRKRLDYCFLLVRQLGKEELGCEGNCVACDYFNEFFNKNRIRGPGSKTIGGRNEKTRENQALPRHLGYGIGRGVRGLKKTLAEFRKKLTGVDNSFRVDHEGAVKR